VSCPSKQLMPLEMLCQRCARVKVAQQFFSEVFDLTLEMFCKRCTGIENAQKNSGVF